MIVWLEPEQTFPATRGRLEVFGGTDSHYEDLMTGETLVEPNSDWYWRVKGKNGQKRAQSVCYTRRADAVNAVTDEHSSRIVIMDGKILTREQIQAMIQPWHLVVFNRDGSLAREGLVY